MNEFQRKRFDNLLGQAENPAQECIAREHVSRAFGYIDGLLEGDAITPSDYADLFREISAVEARIRLKTYRRIGLAS
jgi:hypothetical protein